MSADDLKEALHDIVTHMESWSQIAKEAGDSLGPCGEGYTLRATAEEIRRRSAGFSDLLESEADRSDILAGADRFLEIAPYVLRAFDVLESSPKPFNDDDAQSWLAHERNALISLIARRSEISDDAPTP